MVKLKDQSGSTLVEVMVAGFLISMVFLIIATVYVTSLKFLRGEQTSPELSAVLALETIKRNASIANDVAVDPAGAWLQLRMETSDPATATTADDRWITYGFVASEGSTRLRANTTNPAGATAVNVTATSPEVVANLVVLPASTFTVTNPTAIQNPADPSPGVATVVNISLTLPSGASGNIQTLTASAAVNRAKS